MPRGIPKVREKQKRHQRNGQKEGSTALLRLTVEFPATTLGLAQAVQLTQDAAQMGEVFYSEISGFKTIDIKDL
jgi:hypothetical protein